MRLIMPTENLKQRATTKTKNEAASGNIMMKAAGCSEKVYIKMMRAYTQATTKTEPLK